MRKLFFIVALILIAPAASAQMFSDSTQKEEASCKKGYIHSCKAAGLGYKKGNDVRQDYKKAAELFEMGCSGKGSKRSLSACTELAELYAQGKGVPKNMNYAIKIHTETCASSTSQVESGGTFSCTALADMYRDGKGVKKNRAMAKELYGQACDKQNSGACIQYKKMNN